MSGHKLFPIGVQGQGTAEVESLPSYLFRSAFSHGVTVGVLLKVICELSVKSELLNSKSFSGKEGVETLARVNRYTWALREALTELTGRDLACEPLRFLDSQVYCISTEIGGFRWCSECLAEMERVGATFYFKQLWHMTVITHCPVHRTPLACNCEYCGSTQALFNAKRPVGWCVKCGIALSRRKKLSSKDIQPSWQCPSHDVVEIFEKSARPGLTRADWFDAKFFVREMDRLAGCQVNIHVNRELKLLLGEFSRNWKGNCRLISLRRLAYLMNMSLYDLLTSNGGAYRLPFDYAEAGELPEHLRKRKKVVRRHTKEYQKILAILDKQIIPPSLKQLARMANVSVGYLTYRFPSLVRKVIEDSQSYLQRQSLIRRYRAQTAALKFFSDDRYASYTQSRKEAYRVLSEETGLPKWVLNDAIQVAYDVFSGES